VQPRNGKRLNVLEVTLAAALGSPFLFGPNDHFWPISDLYDYTLSQLFPALALVGSLTIPGLAASVARMQEQYRLPMQASL
jgi:hypothetical protein